ncbi:MAG: carbon-nitrogen hydrolase family protein, partial [Lachnospiraceae bacterium]|nr:carbon-nitrogen hydrolase family protein [Lachnospiraceae bacterium]
MRTALIQMRIQKENERNIRTACSLVREAAGHDTDLVMLPEMFSCPYETNVFRAYAQPDGGENWKALSAIAREKKIYLAAGSMPELASGNVYNTCYVFDRQGRQIAKHRKMHLFDIDVKGGQSFRESETLTAGNEVTLFDTEYGRMGLMICFDIRFPELARLLALGGAKMILVPAAFNMTTGPTHWELAFRSRAVDNQVFMLGCSPARDMQSSYHAYGHSLVVSPWGDVLAELDECEGILYCDFDPQDTEDVRRQLPLLEARRTDIYTLSGPCRTDIYTLSGPCRTDIYT